MAAARYADQVLRHALCVIVLIACMVYGASVDQGRGATAANLRQIHIEEDAFLNYDFTDYNHSRYEVDWAMALLFWNNGSVDGVKEALHDAFPSSGSYQHAYVNNGSGWQWDEDSGQKEHPCLSFGEVVHYRIYAPIADAFYNQKWGYYAIASVHIDNNECNFFGTWFGNSEKAEGIVADVFAGLFGDRSVREDALWFRNFERKEEDANSDHHWENDGYATKLRMPEYYEVMLT